MTTPIELAGHRTEAGRALFALLTEADVTWPDQFTRIGRGALFGFIANIEEQAARSTPVPAANVSECECVPGHRCDCEDLRSLLYRILTNAEYPKEEAEGLAAAALGLHWSEKDDRYVR